jgi:hypothetical protein
MIYYQNLEDLILSRHEANHADRLRVFSGYIGPSPIEKISKRELNVEIAFGCFKCSGVNRILHEKYQKITEVTNTRVFYSDRYNHSKIYCWHKDGEIVDVLAGSANFSNNGLANDDTETLFEIQKSDYLKLSRQVDGLFRGSSLCTGVSVDEDKVKIPDSSGELSLDEIISKDPPKAKIYLGGRGRGLQSSAGLNWGHSSRAHNRKSDAYLAIRVDLLKGLSNLFPNNGENLNHGEGQSHRNSKKNAEAIFDDGTVMDLSFEGIGSDYFGDKNRKFIKQLSSYPTKDILGKYFRNRLSLGENDKVTDDDLRKYGRDTIEVSLLDPGVYYIDFSN